MNRIKVKNFLGAEELLELGQASVSPQLPNLNAARNIILSREEAGLFTQVVQNIVSFAQDYPIEFHSYCPMEKWQETLNQVGTWNSEVDRKLKANAPQIVVPADVVFRTVDLEKCVTAARDARLSSAKLAFGISAGGTLASALFGLSWITVPTYIAGLAILFGRPLLAKLQPDPEGAYRQSIGCGKGFSLAGCPPPDETPEEALMIKYMERVILTAEPGRRTHYWGSVDCDPRGEEGATCLKKGRWRVRVEGWAGDSVTPGPGWEFSDDCEEAALNTVGVWETDSPRRTDFGELPTKSRHEETYWVEYIGPNTNGKMRKAGPFGCPFDTRDHALEDGAITDRGVDGDYLLLDEEGNAVEIEEEATSEAA